MTHETLELNFNDLDAVSGGSDFSASVLTSIAANERFNEWQGRDSNSTRQPPANIISSS